MTIETKQKLRAGNGIPRLQRRAARRGPTGFAALQPFGRWNPASATPNTLAVTLAAGSVRPAAFFGSAL